MDNLRPIGISITNLFIQTSKALEIPYGLDVINWYAYKLHNVNPCKTFLKVLLNGLFDCSLGLHCFRPILALLLPNSRFAKLLSPAIVWKIWKALYSRGCLVGRLLSQF